MGHVTKEQRREKAQKRQLTYFIQGLVLYCRDGGLARPPLTEMLNKATHLYNLNTDYPLSEWAEEAIKV